MNKLNPVTTLSSDVYIWEVLEKGGVLKLKYSTGYDVVITYLQK